MTDLGFQKSQDILFLECVTPTMELAFEKLY